MICGRVIKKSEALAELLMFLIVAETLFGNTPLQSYSLAINRVFFFIEVIVFSMYLFYVKYSKKKIIAFLLLMIVFLCSYFTLSTSALFKMFMMAVAVDRIGIEKVFGILFKLKTTIILLVAVLSIVGIIPNSLMEVEKGIGTAYGYSLGYTHPNRLAGAICCTILCYIGWKNKKCNAVDVVGIGLVATIGYCITKCRTLLYCVLIFIVFYTLLKGNWTRRITEKMISGIGIISVPLCVTTSIAFPLLLLSSSGVVQQVVYEINRLFSRRFTHIEHMFLTYPVTLTGGIFDTKQMSELFEYAVVDNGYIRFLYQYGIIGLFIFGIISLISVHKLKKKHEYIWIVVFIVVAVEGLLENIYVDIGLNLMVVFWAELIESVRKGKR